MSSLTLVIFDFFGRVGSAYVGSVSWDGSITYQIEAYGTVDITVDTPTGRREGITLQYVALIPGFFTNLISLVEQKKTEM